MIEEFRGRLTNSDSKSSLSTSSTYPSDARREDTVMHDFDDDKVHDNDDNDINLDAEVAASMGEDFDDFTQEQENAGDDDFGDFDDGFQEPEEATDDIPVNQPSQTPPEALSVVSKFSTSANWSTKHPSPFIPAFPYIYV